MIINGFSPNGLCIDIVEIWFEIADQFLTELSASATLISFQDNNLSKSQWIFTKLEMCIDIVEIWFGIAFGYIT